MWWMFAVREVFWLIQLSVLVVCNSLSSFSKWLLISSGLC